MKKQESKNKTAYATLAISKIAVFLLLLFAGSARAQTPVVAPYPDIEIGQRITIPASDPRRPVIMEQSSITRNLVQAYVNDYPNGDPVNKESCSGNICCETYIHYNPYDGTTRYVTYCWNKITYEDFDEIVQ